MRPLMKKRLVIAALAILSAVFVYMVAYFTCVSIGYEQHIGYPIVSYKVGPLSQHIAHSFFEPARLCDVHLLRPHRWEDLRSIDAPITEWKLETASTNKTSQK